MKKHMPWSAKFADAEQGLLTGDFWRSMHGTGGLKCVRFHGTQMEMAIAVKRFQKGVNIYA